MKKHCLFGNNLLSYVIKENNSDIKLYYWINYVNFLKS